MNEVELRIEKFIDLLDLKGNKELTNIKKCTITKFRETILFESGEVLKSLRYTIDQIELKCGRINIYQFNVVDTKERERKFSSSKQTDSKNFFKKFNEEMYEGRLYFVENAKTKKPLMLVYVDCSKDNAVNSEELNDDRFVVIM